MKKLVCLWWEKIRAEPFLSSLIGLLGGLFIIFLIALCCDDPQWIYPRLGLEPESGGKYEALKFLGLGMGGLLIALQALMSYKRAKALEDNVETTERGQRQERLKNAIEHLGNDRDSVRLGGAYELFHLAEDTKGLRRTVLDILCAHIRSTTGEAEYRKAYLSKPSEEIQSLLTLLFVQEHEVFKGLRINLQGSWLNGARLFQARLEEAILAGAYLRGADLRSARLQGAVLYEAQLQGAVLSGAWMQDSYLRGARMQGTSLHMTQLHGANLVEAQMQGADLRGAWLQASALALAQLQGANLAKAMLQEAMLGEVRLQGVSSTRALGEILPPFKDWMRERIGEATELTGAIFAGGLTQGHLDFLTEDLSDATTERLRERLTRHVDKPESNKLEDAHAVKADTGAYTAEEAEQWIAEYERAMSEVPGESNS